jgi:glycosyltransferase involved in cell wall biosynthesis
MDRSVVITALNGRDTLSATLESIAEHLPAAEVIVANGPSADGTSGLISEHAAVDTVLELSERNPNVARNAGLAAASGDAIAFIGQGTRLEPGWGAAVDDALAGGADAVTGPVHRELGGDVTTERSEETDIGSRTVRYFDSGNVAFTRSAIEGLDGFDERLAVGAARDAAHRLAGLDLTLRWEPEASVLRSPEETGGRVETGADQAALNRSRGYRMAKNYGLGWITTSQLARMLLGEGLSETGAVVTGESAPSIWARKGREAVLGAIGGLKAGFVARLRDRSDRRNPYGLSARENRPLSSSGR